MKYARLPLQDLKDLEKEFIDFLVINGIPAEDWEKFKKEDQNKVEELLDLFSDVIWEDVLTKTKIVEHRRFERLTVCKIINDELITLVVKSDDPTFDFTNAENIEKAILNLANFQMNIQKSKIQKETNLQLFELLELGFYIVSDSNYEKLFEQLN